ncbi:amidohydrolase family protein [Frigoribacterium sp. CG_9.8]|uniref:amidohydrolase family protein n=1 Tax=Frigoribacterium sp. CG_9.8 TaxID=2787733 RepID=UPI0018CB0283|nr:amidohydrolase family protein [Frigoribacterium sp. CG_9.8]MBG6106904.1 putative TIM-barrel fold metal-dependent hydrolase [Frigoribacterium sp. CG_9.8]
MGSFIDLSNIPVIDNHCHAVEAVQSADPVEWLRRFTESPDPEMANDHVRHTAFYRRLMSRAAEFYGIAPDREDELLAHREKLGAAAMVTALFQDARIGGVVIDTGYPAPDKAMAPAALVEASGAEYVALMRLEVEFQRLITLHDDFGDLISAVGELVTDLRATGFVGFKSIAAYRTGLAIERWDTNAARVAFGQARGEVAASGRVRLGYKPLLDTLLHIAFEAAAAQRLPVQFHVGYGDPDVDIRQASPLQLRALFEEPAYRSMPIVMLHGCWPYFREGAYLAAVYGNAYLDVSYSIPFLSRSEMTSMTRAALGAAPFSKVMYSSDAVGIPEMHWMGAIEGRQAIGTALGEMVDAGELNQSEARDAGRLMLNATAARLYGLSEAAR